MSNADKKAVRNLALFCAAVFIVANPKGAAKTAAIGIAVLSASIYGIRAVQ